MFDRKILKCILHKAIYFSVIFLLLTIPFACNQNKPSNISQTTDSQEQTKTTAVKTEQSKSSSDLLAKAKNPQRQARLLANYKKSFQNCLISVRINVFHAR